MTRRDNITRWRAKGLWMDVFQLLGVVPKEIRCQFIILARKDEPTADYARHRITRKDELLRKSGLGLAAWRDNPPDPHEAILFGPSFAIASLSLQLLSTCAADMGSKWVR